MTTRRAVLSTLFLCLASVCASAQDPALMRKAQAGDPQAQFTLGEYYLGQKDPANAIAWLEKSGKGGNVRAQADLAAIYWGRFWVPPDPQKALMWATKAAEAGDPGSQLNLWGWYSQGDVIPKDQAKALYWAKKAAAQGKDTEIARAAKDYLAKLNQSANSTTQQAEQQRQREAQQEREAEQERDRQAGQQREQQAATGPRNVPPPKLAEENGPSLEETMKFIQDKLSGQAKAWIEYVTNNITSQVIQSFQFSEALTKIDANPGACRVSYHFKTTRDGQLFREGDLAFNFKDVQNVVVYSMEQNNMVISAAEGHPENVFKFDPPIFALEAKRMFTFYFYDEDLANRVAKAIVHAVELCAGGGKPEPF